MITHTEIEQGSDVCPSCKSEDWKSAKMVVMEGTTNTSGTLGGAVTDPGMLSGGVRNFLLSDRWFSWDYPLEAEIGLTSSTGLVEEVKRLMVHYRTTVQMPIPPPEPTMRILKYPAYPKPPNEPEWPKEPEKPEEPSGPEKTTAKHINSLAFYGALFLGAIMAIFSKKTRIELHEQNKARYEEKLAEYKEKKAEYERKIKLWPEVLKNYQRDKEKWQKDRESHETNVKNYYIQRKSQEKEFAALHQKQLAEYEAEKINVMKVRESLWERARVCMRCGTAYLGGN